MYRMLDDCVLVDPITGSGDASQGGILMPEKMGKRPIKGTVLAVGPGQKMDDGSRYPLDVKVGAIVAFPAKSGDHIFLDGNDYIVIPERYILMTLSDPEEEQSEYAKHSGPLYGLKDTPENHKAIKQAKDGEYLRVDNDGNIIPKNIEENE